MTANRNDPGTASRAPYRAAIAALVRALVALQDAADGVLDLDPDGYEPENEHDEQMWDLALGEAEFLRHAVRHAFNTVDWSLPSSVETFLADVDEEQAGAV